MSADVLDTVHRALLVAFVSVTLLLFVVTLLDRLRVRRVRLTWRTGRFFGWPLGPLAFLLLLGVLAGVNHVVDTPIEWLVLAGYAVGGAFWLAASLVSCAVVATDDGILLDADHAVAWGQVVDYFVAGGASDRYVFLYVDDDERRRLELSVPATHRKPFRRLLGEKLDTRFERSLHPLYGRTELEG